MVASVRRLLFRKRKSVDFLSGNIPRTMISYAVPLLFGNILQYLYSAVDSWVLGQSGQTEAYAAVGSLTPVTQALVALFWGFSQGAGIIISRAHGASDKERVSRGAHTALIVTVLIGIFLTVVGVLLSPVLLRLVLGADGDPEIYNYAKTYLLIFFGGIIPMLVYNIGAEIMRSLGNSHYPFLFLCFGSVLNIILDLVFVFSLGMGIAGVAWATVIAQALSAVLVVFLLFSERSPIRLTPQNLRIDRSLTAAVVRLGIPVSIENAICNVSAILVQSYIAATGDQAAVLGGYSTYVRIMCIFEQPAVVILTTVAVFVGQNIGASNTERARQGVRWGMLLAFCAILPTYIGITLLADYVPYIFTSDAAVVERAAELFRNLTIFYIVQAIGYPFLGAMRGLGKTKAIMVLTMASQIAACQVYLFVMSRFISNEFVHIVFAVPFGHIAFALVMGIAYVWNMRRIMRSGEIMAI